MPLGLIKNISCMSDLTECLAGLRMNITCISGLRMDKSCISGLIINKSGLTRNISCMPGEKYVMYTIENPPNIFVSSLTKNDVEEKNIKT